MKQQKLLVSVLLIVLCLGSWYQTFAGTASRNQKEYTQSVSRASEYMDRGLYQKAAEEYKNALSIKDSQKLWAKLLSAYSKRYAEDEGIYDEYLEAAKQAVSAYGKNAKFVLTLSHLYSDNEDYKKAYSCLKKAIDDGASDKELLSAMEELKYGYELLWKSYRDYTTNTFGYYAVKENDEWKYLSLEGKEEKVGPFEYAGKAGQSGLRLVADKERVEIIDENGVVQGKFDFIPMDSRMPSEGYCVIKNGESYGVYTLLGDKILGDYDDASSVFNGTLATKGKSEWSIIDIEGKSACEKTFEDIKLSVADTYTLNGVMIAKEGEKYALYNTNYERIGDFVADDIDCYTGYGNIAFCKDGKWGYVDTEGKVVIEPKYENAKSFSNGLAGVCIDGMWGFINESGDVVIEPFFNDVGYFNNKGKCMVSMGRENWQMLSLNIWGE